MFQLAKAEICQGLSKFSSDSSDKKTTMERQQMRIILDLVYQRPTKVTKKRLNHLVLHVLLISHTFLETPTLTFSDMRNKPARMTDSEYFEVRKVRAIFKTFII
jgi:hypothetical protein